jgi:hypothetical protein
MDTGLRPIHARDHDYLNTYYGRLARTSRAGRAAAPTNLQLATDSGTGLAQSTKVPTDELIRRLRR